MSVQEEELLKQYLDFIGSKDFEKLLCNNDFYIEKICFKRLGDVGSLAILSDAYLTFHELLTSVEDIKKHLPQLLYQSEDFEKYFEEYKQNIKESK